MIKARGGIHTKNVVFVTNPKVRAVFSAPTVTLEQGKVSDVHSTIGRGPVCPATCLVRESATFSQHLDHPIQRVLGCSG